MATMDITPQELRDIEIREAWRGYHRDDVDELLERAAATIEHLESEVAQMRSRGSQAPAPSVAPPPARAAVPTAPAPVPVPATGQARMPDADVIQRTLLLAQKAADEAVSEAKARAAQIISESEAQAQALVAEAESTARRIADAEKSRLEAEVGQLIAARDTLTSDVDALTSFEVEYKDRLRRAIETELESLAEMRSLAGQRPPVHDVDLPSPVGDAPTDASWAASQESVVVAPEPVRSDSTVQISAASAGEAPGWDPAPAGGWGEAPTARVVDDSIEMEVPAHGDSLDDDAFFASLREAVRDDAPLGPGDDDQTRFYDQDDSEDHRGLFKRRR